MIEILNELTIYMNQQMFTLLLNSHTSYEIRSNIGWVIISLSFLNISLNLCLFILFQSMQFVNSMVDKNTYKKVEEALKKRTLNRE